MDVTVNFTVNGKKKTVTTDAGRSLLEVLREELDLTGTKYGCGEGRCGACTVIMDGQRVLSCVMPVAQTDNKSITTIEGLADGDDLHPIQEAFVEKSGMQCGFCTPGMIMSAKALLDGNPNPNKEEIREGIAGNFCRCTGYTKIIESISAAANTMKGEE